MKEIMFNANDNLFDVLHNIPRELSDHHITFEVRGSGAAAYGVMTIHDEIAPLTWYNKIALCSKVLAALEDMAG